MKRIALVVSVILLVLMVVPIRFGTHYGGSGVFVGDAICGATKKSSTTTSTQSRTLYYVVAERRDLNVVCAKYTDKSQVDKRITELQAEATATSRADNDILKEISTLKSKLAGLKSALAVEKDSTKKQELTAKIEETETALKDKQAGIKPVVAWQISDGFPKVELADAYIAQIEDAAKAAQAKRKADEAKKTKP